MPAEEAMLLYLLLHHAFYSWELRTVRIPSQCRPIALGAEPREWLEDVLSLEWQPPGTFEKQTVSGAQRRDSSDGADRRAVATRLG